MNFEKVKQILFVLLAALCFANGFWALLAPANWFAGVPLDLQVMGPANAYLVMQVGVLYGLAGFLLVTLARATEPARGLHIALTGFFLAQLLMYVILMPSASWLANPWAAVYFDVPLLICVLTLVPWSNWFGQSMQTGTVKWFNPNKGFGFILTDDGEEVFVHYRSVEGRGRRVLRDGDAVRFVVVAGQKGPQAENVKKIKT